MSRPENEAKASFEDVYGQLTPHAYLREMRTLGYQIGQQARPFARRAAEWLGAQTETRPVQMLDVGCSYGMGAAFLKWGCSFEEIVSFFESRAPTNPVECAAAMRMWLRIVPPAIDMRVVGLDVSANAIEFAVNAGLIDGGISRNLESAAPNDDDHALLRGCNLLVSTGAIGYVGESTFSKILSAFADDWPENIPRVAVMTILRMFDSTPVERAFTDAGWTVAAVPDVLLPQRAFADETEQREIVDIVRDRGFDPRGWEDQGVLYAQLFVATAPDRLNDLASEMSDVRATDPIFAPQVEVATARKAD